MKAGESFFSSLLSGRHESERDETGAYFIDREFMVSISLGSQATQSEKGGGGGGEWPGDEARLVFREYSISSSLSFLIKESNL